MVQVYQQPAASSPSGSAAATPSDAAMLSAATTSYFTLGVQARMMTREEHAQKMKELRGRRPQLRSPQRSYSASEWQAEREAERQQEHARQEAADAATAERQKREEKGAGDEATVPAGGIASSFVVVTSPPREVGAQMVSAATALPRPETPTTNPSTAGASTAQTSPTSEAEVPASPHSPPHDADKEKGKEAKPQAARPRRPHLGPPRRSYSVTDHPPVPLTSRPGRHLQLVDLPIEIHHVVFDFLDDLDGTVLGLTNRHFHVLANQRIGRVSLKTGRMGPNDQEWCWRTSGDLMKRLPRDVLRKTFPLRTTTGSLEAVAKYQELSQYRLKGRQWCNLCGANRCELQRHVREVFGPDVEFCEISEKFGPAAGKGKDGAVVVPETCSRRSPNKPDKCRRHHPKGKKTAESS